MFFENKIISVHLLFYFVVICISMFLQINPVYSQNIINYEENVPYIRQNDYAEFGLSSCAPSSTAMILNYHFSNSDINPGHVYHSGTQAYTYDGALQYYRNVGFQGCAVTSVCIDDTDLTAIEEEGQSNYSGNYSGVIFNNIENYLENYWGANVTVIDNNRNAIIDALDSGPIIASVNVCGSGRGHYLVVHNINDNGTTDIDTDDYVVVNDPEPNCTIYNQTRNGQNKEILLSTFLRDWVNNGLYKISFPNTSKNEKKYSVIVSPSHSTNDGYTGIGKYPKYVYENFTDTLDENVTILVPLHNKLMIEDEDLNSINYYYGSGKSVIYLDPSNNSNTNISSVKWKPNIEKNGYYHIEYIYFDSGNTEDIVFYLKNEKGNTVSIKSIQYSNNQETIRKLLFSGNISQGYYVEANNIPKAKDINIDTI